MSTIKQKGAPTRKTNGAVGDIYVDLNTGNRYKCVFAYGNVGDLNYERQWKIVSEKPFSKKPAVEKTIEKTVEKKVEEVKTEPVVEEKASVIEEPVGEEPADEKTKRTDYTSYSKKK